jgi:hypothetical protein
VHPTAEEQRLAESLNRHSHWKRWGPYVSDRAWGTVREDYSELGKVWDYFPHDQARSRAYRWNEDGIAGICDRHQEVCFALALWNGRDPILKERLFGLNGNEGNHGEDCKECYYYLDSTPTHSYMKMLYKYPQGEFPYEHLLRENKSRGLHDRELDLVDTGIFDEGRYWDIFIEYAKATSEDILIEITAHNRGPEAATLHLLPTIWFRNTWSWGNAEQQRPILRETGFDTVTLETQNYGVRRLVCDPPAALLFTDNDSNRVRLFGAKSSGYAKDGIVEYVVNGNLAAVNPEKVGTKCAVHYIQEVAAGESVRIRLRFSDDAFPNFNDFDQIFAARKGDADAFYATIIPTDLSSAAKGVMRQAFAGLMWTKQFYHYVVRDWLAGDPGQPPPPEARKVGRNKDWKHLYNADVISMPDKWEYPWYAAWDLAFHCLPIALIDSAFAKDQLLLMLREWYMHPNGQIPAYEWALGDVNPPVHAWAALRVFQIEQKRQGHADHAFLAKVFHKLLLNFTWWVNRKDDAGDNIFEGGFLGLDNIGIFDRSAPMPSGGRLEQADSTGWMAMYNLNLLAMALQLAQHDSSYEDVASKFWEHFLGIANAINHLGDGSIGMWNEEDGFYYDVLHLPDGRPCPLKVRSMVGLIPLFAVETVEEQLIDRLPGFKRRMEWFIDNREDLTCNVASLRTQGVEGRRLLSIVGPEQLRRILKFVLDEDEFLSPYGIRGLSKYHDTHPYSIRINGVEHRVSYEPAESTTGLFGGNSNWRGPVWFPLNYLLIESLQKFHYYLGDDFKVECPTGSGNWMTLWEVAAEISRRLTHLFLPDARGSRPVNGECDLYRSDRNWKDLVLFYEYFHGDTGEGLGASHQTGWTALVAKPIQQSGE